VTPRRRASGLVAATLVAAAGLVGWGAGSASAAQCTDAKGVSVVVDYSHGAGGGLATACDASGGGRSARAIITGSGFSLQPVQSSPGFVCQVEHRPSAARCQNVPPASAYWGLFWAKAGSSSWIYSSEGIDSLNIPAGGAVAFAFQDGGGTDYPGQAPSTRSKPSPTPKPSPKPTPKPKPKPKPTKVATATKGGSAAGTVTTTPSAGATAKAAATRSTATPTASPSASASTSASVVATTASPGDSPGTAAEQPDTKLTSAKPDPSGLPVWVPVAAVVALLAATGGVLWWRRASGGGPGPA
jgi:hypothetical protein